MVTNTGVFVLLQPSQKLVVEAEQGSVCHWFCQGSGKEAGHLEPLHWWWG